MEPSPLVDELATRVVRPSRPTVTKTRTADKSFIKKSKERRWRPNIYLGPVPNVFLFKLFWSVRTQNFLYYRGKVKTFTTKKSVRYKRMLNNVFSCRSSYALVVHIVLLLRRLQLRFIPRNHNKGRSFTKGNWVGTRDYKLRRHTTATREPFNHPALRVLTQYPSWV